MKTVLLYNFSEERLAKVKAAVMLAKAGARVVGSDDFCRKLGFLIGAEGFDDSRDEQAGGFDEEMLVMSGFDSRDIDRLIKALRTTGVGRVALKAVVTPTNIGWNSVQLYRAVRADHDEMNRKRS